VKESKLKRVGDEKLARRSRAAKVEKAISKSQRNCKIPCGVEACWRQRDTGQHRSTGTQDAPSGLVAADINHLHPGAPAIAAAHKPRDTSVGLTKRHKGQKGLTRHTPPSPSPLLYPR